MSIISTFYLGDKQKVTESFRKDYSLLGDKSVTNLDVTYTIGGGGLLSEDFDSMLPKKFISYKESVLYGDPNPQTSESQLIILSPEFASIVSKMTDNELVKISKRINIKRKEMLESYDKVYKRKGVWWEKRSMSFYVYGTMLSLLWIHVLAKEKSLNFWTILLAIPIILYWLRPFSLPVFSTFGGKRESAKIAKTEIDWTQELKQLRSISRQSQEKKIPLLYYWSL